jgi:hypothetical protein
MSAFPSPLWTSTAEETDQVVPLDLCGDFEDPLVSSGSSPSTPRRAPKISSSTPPPLNRPRLHLMPPLLRALHQHSFEKVRAVLTESPEAATELFWDQACEPPLCAAVRLKCSAAIIKVLLAYGADADAQNARARTPSELLKAMKTAPAESAPTFEVPRMCGLRPMTLEAINIPTAINISTMEWHNEVCELLSA